MKDISCHKFKLTNCIVCFYINIMNFLISVQNCMQNHLRMHFPIEIEFFLSGIDTFINYNWLYKKQPMQVSKFIWLSDIICLHGLFFGV